MGITLTTSTLIKIILLIIVILIIISLIAYVYAYFLPKTTIDLEIAKLCSEWEENGCQMSDAETIKGTKYLSELCSDYFGLPWNEGTYLKCKKKCMCP